LYQNSAVAVHTAMHVVSPTKHPPKKVQPGPEKNCKELTIML